MHEPAVWRATNTHLYPGARLKAEASKAVAGPITIEFADLGTANARLERRGRDWVLRVGEHRTQRGVAILPKAWQVAPLPESESANCWRVLRRADKAPSER
jgi:hypothetical protein